MTWIRRRDWHIITSGVLTYSTDDRYQVLHNENSDNWDLKIKYATKRDTGTYECQVSYPIILQFFLLFRNLMIRIDLETVKNFAFVR